MPVSTRPWVMNETAQSPCHPAPAAPRAGRRPPPPPRRRSLLLAEKTWQLLDNAIQEINNHNASGLSYEELYRNAYNMVVNKYGERLYTGLVETETTHLQQVASRVEAAQGESLLRALRAEWENHNKSVSMIRDILMVCSPLQRGRLLAAFAAAAPRSGLRGCGCPVNCQFPPAQRLPADPTRPCCSTWTAST